MTDRTPVRTELAIRRAANTDSDGVIALIDSVLREYGDRVHLEKADRDLTEIESTYNGAFWVLCDGEKVLGTVAITCDAQSPEVCFLKRLYLSRTLRGTGWGERLLERAIDAARDAGHTRMHFWTDIRFTRAHAFYERRGFVSDGRTRTLDDAWEPYTEYFYSRDL